MYPDQHFTVAVQPFKRAIRAAGLAGHKVLEIGAGHGEITQLILDERPALLRSYEIERGLCTLRHELLELREESFVLGDAMTMRGWSIVSVPPYCLLGTIRETLQWLMPARAILLVPSYALSAFSDFNVLCMLDGSTSFSPPSKGDHAIIYRGFGVPDVPSSV